MGHGHNSLCDPILKGHITNEQEGPGIAPDRNTVYRYSKSLRGCDEAVMDMFRDIVVLDEQGKQHNVPIIWGTQEKAVTAIMQENFRKDETLVVDRIKLPIMSIHNTKETFDPNRYVYHKAIDYMRNHAGKPGFAIKERFEKDTVFGVSRGLPVNKSYSLHVWTLYREDMNQIIEQVLPKLMPMGYIRVRGVPWEIGVKLDDIGNNIEVNPGDQAINVYKYQFDMTAESYVPQPIVRKKSVLKTRVEVVDSVNDDITSVIMRLEETIKELQ
jgi:hypothetical protein